MRLKVLHTTDTKSVSTSEFLLLPNHFWSAVFIDQSSFRDPHPKRVSAGSQDWDSEAGERARCLTARDTHHVMPGLVLVWWTSACPQWGRASVSQGWQGHQPHCTVKGNFCSSTALPISSLWANFNHRVTAVRVKNLTLL